MRTGANSTLHFLSLRVTPVPLVSILCPSISFLHPLLLHLIVFRRKQRGKIWNWSCFWPLIHSAAMDSVVTPQTWNLKPTDTTRAPQDETYQGKKKKKNPVGQNRQKWEAKKDKNCCVCLSVVHYGCRYLFKTEGCFCLLCRLFCLTCLF